MSTLPTSKSAFQKYNPGDNQMLVSQSIHKVKVASTLERFARKLSRTMSAKFQHF